MNCLLNVPIHDQMNEQIKYISLGTNNPNTAIYYLSLTENAISPTLNMIKDHLLEHHKFLHYWKKSYCQTIVKKHDGDCHFYFVCYIRVYK